MGLAERRVIAEFQEKRYPSLKTSVDQAAGFAVDIEVDWNSLALPEKSRLYDECFPKVYFRPLIEAFQQITKDDLGKSALQSGLKKVFIKNANNRSSPKGIEFAAGVLTIDHLPTTNVDDIEERADQIVKVLEAAL